MANEIIGLESSVGKVRALFYYPIPGGVRIQVAGVNAVPTPSADLPEEADAAITALGAPGTAMKAALDAGEALFVSHGFDNPEGITGAALLAEMRAQYAAQTTRILAAYTARYQYAGDVFDAE